MEIFRNIVLALSGLAMIYACSTRMFKPTNVVFLNPQIQKHALTSDTNLLNEIRGIGGVLLLSGIVVLMGIFIPSVRTASFVIAWVVFGGITIGRILSIIIEGMPNSIIIKVFIVEFVLAILNIYCMVGMIKTRMIGS